MNRIVGRRAAAAFAMAFGLATTGCDQCAGTVSCHVAPQLSYGGQIIEHRSGAIVPGTTVTFVRESGVALESDTVRGVSDDAGFFTLRANAADVGEVIGHIVVDGPGNIQPYVIPAQVLTSSRVHGEGGFLGRITVRPYMLLVGHIRDRFTYVPVESASVTISRDSGGRFSQDSLTFTTDVGGQFAWYPDVVEASTVYVTFQVHSRTHARTFRISRALPLLYRDGDMSFQIMPAGIGFPYYGWTGRRGWGSPAPGTMVRMRRTGGVEVEQNEITVEVPYGRFDVHLRPKAAGTANVELSILPPAPYTPETHHLTLQTSDDDVADSLGFFGYGVHVYASADLRYADSGEPVAGGTFVTFKRVSGLSIEWPTPPEGDLRVVDKTGRVLYGAPTDSGQVVFDLIVRLPAPFAWDTIPAVGARARYSDVPFNVGTLLVRRRLAP
jgi:hypothetical protein